LTKNARRGLFVREVWPGGVRPPILKEEETDPAQTGSKKKGRPDVKRIISPE